MKDKILELRAQNKTYLEISILLSCSKSTVSYYCSEGSKEKVLERTRNRRAGLAGKPKEKVTHLCLNCERKVRLHTSIYCTHKCQKDYEQKDFINKWLDNKVSGHGNGKNNVLSSFVRKYILKLNGNTCSICGWNKVHPIDGKPLVEIDHIDGNSKNSFLDNLRVLCPNCHSETPTFRARNKKSSRIRK